VSPVCPGSFFRHLPPAKFDVVFESDVAFAAQKQIREWAACGAGLVLPRLARLCRDISATEGEEIAPSGGDAWVTHGVYRQCRRYPQESSVWQGTTPV
jgi:hypothetical protein